jgi:hypothetical protein
MFGQNPRLNPLEARKQLLLAESELNRAQLVEDFAALTADIQTLKDRAKSLGSVVSSAAVLVAGLVAFRGRKPVETPIDTKGKLHWLRTILKGASLISTFWLAYHAQDREQKDA